MTYQTTTHPAAIAQRSIAGLRRFFMGIGHAMMVNSAAHSRYERVQYLQAKTDAELAEMGLERDTIAHHVFKDLYYM